MNSHVSTRTSRDPYGTGHAPAIRLGDLNDRSVQGVDSRNLRSILGASAGQEDSNTLAYRVRGQDTLTTGDSWMWIRAYWFGLNLRYTPTPNWLEQYSELENIEHISRLQEIDKLFDVQDSITVKSFLVHTPVLIGCLIQSHAALLKYFEADTKFVLRPLSDPNLINSMYLAVYIQTRMPVDEAMEKLDDFELEWLYDQIDLIEGRIIFNLNFL